MDTPSLALAVATTLALTVSAHSESRPSEASQAERWGPQFLIGWSMEDQEAATKALHALEGKDGIDEILLARQARILRKIERGYTFYDINWGLIQPFVLQDEHGNRRAIFQFTLPEMILTGFAVSRDRYCRWEDQDMDEDPAKAYCAEMNRRAIQVFSRLEKARHALPGGATAK
jgi:hypothetical protein